MAEETLYMSSKEVDRVVVVKDLLSRKITQKEAGSLLSISERQVRRLVKSYCKYGKQGLVSKKRGTSKVCVSVTSCTLNSQLLSHSQNLLNTV